jgi:hypothetical protein
VTSDKFSWKQGDVQWEKSEDFGDQLSPDDLNDTPVRAEKVINSAGDERAAERLRHYWAHGEGAAKIGWGTPGDFDRCVSHVGKYMRDPKGYCNLRHHEALGYYPATHAAMERGHKGEEPALVKGYYPDASELLNMIVGLIEEAEEN